jgi:hypothetical protein
MMSEVEKAEYVVQTYPLISEQGQAYLQFIARSLLLVQNPAACPIPDEQKPAAVHEGKPDLDILW